MAKVLPVIVKEPQPIINNAVYRCLEVELVAECVKLKMQIQVLQGERGEVNVIRMGAFMEQHGAVDTRVHVDS